MYKGVIFDLDGTLLNTLGDLTASVNHVCRKYGYEERTIDEVRSFIGNGIRNLISRVVPNGFDNPLFEEMMKELEIIVDELEKGTLSLDEAVKKYQRGIELSAELKKKLENAKQVVVTKIGEEEIPF
jgi:exodeoxyribonuclease VII small subunit